VKLTIETPALLFPAISFLVLAYTNRYSALTRLARELLREFSVGQADHLAAQIGLVRQRIRIIRLMLTLAATSMFSCVVAVLMLFEDLSGAAKLMFMIGLALLCITYALAVLEIHKSVEALDIQTLATLSEIPPGPLDKLKNDIASSRLGRRTMGLLRHVD
jgi:Protein of unknown function (DUF2721)